MSIDRERLLFESEVGAGAGADTTVRHCVEETVADEFPGQPGLDADVALVTSELMANLLRMARDQVVVRVLAERDAVTVEVIDDGPGAPRCGNPIPAIRLVEG